MKFRSLLNTREDGPCAGNIAYMFSDQFEQCCASGYHRLDENPEVIAGVLIIAQLVASMTIGLWENTDSGDRRLKNELSRKIDIDPYKNMTRSNWMQGIVKTLLLSGKGNAVIIPHTKKGLIDGLEPIAANRVNFIPVGRNDYYLLIDSKKYRPEDVIHCVYNPDPEYLWKGQGITTPLKTLVDNLVQARTTENAFMKSNWKPSIIVKVDGLTKEFSSPQGRAKLLDEYVKPAHPGDPWIIPAEQFAVETVKPLSLSDLAINDTVKIDKKTVAAILGVPSFVVGEGEFNKDEWNNFIKNKLRVIAQGIEQSLTKALILNPNWYLKFNEKSLYAYDEEAVAKMMGDLYVRGTVTGNEVRARLDFEPKEGLDDLVILENFIKLEDIKNQNKLNGGKE